MRLTQIKLAGFKSFVDTTSLPLPSNLTSVVGPNGCGKSNLIDAVRWVLGESSMKQLRSSSSEDVIFNGSRSRKPVGRASVELTFDNSDQTLRGPYAHYSEVSVRRELTRDGQSQYYLNGGKCLRRDVVDLFLGTGLGARSGYAIIEQGMVSRMIEARPEELRQWLEEAAGISKYRERRRETESRIRSTRDNLSRVNDLCGEVRARGRALERQADNARKYQRYREEEARLKVELHYLGAQHTEQQAEQTQQRVGAGQEALRQARLASSEARDARLRAEVELESARNAFNEQQSAHYTVEAERARAEQALRHAREIADMRSRELSQLDQEQQRARQRSEEAQQQEKLAQGRQAALQQTQQEHEAAQQAAVQAVEAAEQALEEASAALQAHDNGSREPLAQLAADRARLREREAALAQLDARLQRLQEEEARNPPPDGAACTQAANESEAARTALAAAQEAARRSEIATEELEQRRGDAEAALARLQSEHSQMKSEQTSLQTLQKAALGEDDAQLRDWLHALGLQDAQRLAGHIAVRDGWDTAVEHVLGQLLQAPMAAELLPALRQRDSAPERGICVVQESAAQTLGAAGTLAAQVQAPPAVLALMRQVHCADELAAAEAMLSGLAEGHSVVTRDGTWLSQGWMRLPARGSGQGVIARSRRLEQLAKRVDDTAERLAQADAQLQSLRQTLQQANQDRKRDAQALESARSALARCEAAELRAQQQFELQRARYEQLQSNLKELRSEAQTRRQDCARLQQELQALETDTARLAEERKALEARLVEARQSRDQTRQTLAQAQRALGETQSQLAIARGEAQAAGQRAQEFSARAAQLADALQERRQQPAQDEALSLAQAALRDAEARMEGARGTLTSARGTLEAREADMARTRNHEQKTQAALETAQATLQEAQLAFQSLDAQRQMLGARFAEFGVRREEVAAQIDPGADNAEWQNRLDAVQRRIERLGAINLAAIDELAETQARAEELERQHADITEALETLEAAIRKIDRETRERFRETFAQVNTRFAARFPRLFGGGEASLELTDDDLLSAGVRVMARPPGKRNTSIHLLSGGEKAMTAVALLLALFELNPAPFCLLDEVDAPLDDANVSRFCEVIREMSSTVQFVIITHNKITMALADHLHGVTMQEPGSSRLVSVDVQHAVSLAGEAA